MLAIDNRLQKINEKWQQSVASNQLQHWCWHCSVLHSRPTDISRRAVLHAAAIRAHKRQRDRQAARASSRYRLSVQLYCRQLIEVLMKLAQSMRVVDTGRAVSHNENCIRRPHPSPAKPLPPPPNAATTSLRVSSGWCADKIRFAWSSVPTERQMLVSVCQRQTSPATLWISLT